MKVLSKEEDSEVAMLMNDPKVNDALQSCAAIKPGKPEKQEKKSWSAITLMLIVLATCSALYFLFGWDYFTVRSRYVPALQKLMLSFILITLILAIKYFLKRFLTRKIDNVTTRYTIGKVSNLVSIIIIITVLFSLLFANWYATLVSFGIISLIVGLALQSTLTSFFGWIYILIRKPYAVGDRIKIGNVKGDVIYLGYFDTMLWECGGEYLSGDHPSGRIVRFTNARVFDEIIHNYSWPLFPFIWNEVKFFIAFESDIQFVTATAQSIAEEEIGEAMMRRVKRFQRILKDTPVDELEVNEKPTISLRASNNTWIEVIVRYLSEPKNAGSIKNSIFNKLLTEFKKHPEKVMFPKSNMR